MKPSLFDYRAPDTIDEAISLLANDSDAAVLAGKISSGDQAGCISTHFM